jgi:putative intracellular protease/amidase
MNVYLYILNTLSDWEIGYLTSEINSGRYFNNTNQKVNLIKVGATAETISTMGGINITPDKAILDISFKKGDILILPGGDTWLDKCNEEVINMVPSLLEKNILVAAICGATVALAHHGILNNKKHTSNDKAYLQASCPRYTGEDFYINKLSVVDHNLITATGLAPIDFSYQIFKKMNTMKEDTLEAWYQLYKTKESKYYYALADSLK